MTESTQAVLDELAATIRSSAWDLALEVVQEGLREDTIPSLARIGRIGQLGDMPTFITELAQELGDPRPDRMRRGSPLAALVRDHAREREALGFAPREIVTEFLLLRRILWGFVTERASELASGDVLVAEQRLNDTIDRLVTECVVAYFDRATSELAHQARSDPLTDLLNHQAFSRELELELERAQRYDHGVSLVFFDFDRFKEINDTLGHPVGDRVLRQVAELLRSSLRRSDLAGRMGGDEYAAFLVESDEETAVRFLSRLHGGIDERIAAGELPVPVGISAGVAHFPTDGTTADALFRIADERLYETKRAKRA
ncbi:MAG: GGDEF domain-containing protein [Actinomycetota bacterium]|nr:GGDEF domain-containing protein [Actinomycetota bacterium]